MKCRALQCFKASPTATANTTAPAPTLRSAVLRVEPHSSGTCVSTGAAGRPKPLPRPWCCAGATQRHPHASALCWYASSRCCSAAVRSSGSGERSAWLVTARGWPSGPSSRSRSRSSCTRSSAGGQCRKQRCNTFLYMWSWCGRVGNCSLKHCAPRHQQAAQHALPGHSPAAC